MINQKLDFRKFHLTAHVVSDVFCQINGNIDSIQCHVSIVLDIMRAFNKVNHTFHITEIREIRYKKKCTLVISKPFTEKISVCVCILYFFYKQVKCGVPRASILDPTLFFQQIKYLSKLNPKITDFSVRLFADDTAVSISDRNLDNLKKVVNNKLDKIEKCLFLNKLTLT